MRRRILIVEDDPQIASLLERELGRLGYCIDVAGTAGGALAALAAKRPQLMLLDLGLPDRDGQELLQQLRDRRDALPVICLTARDQQMDRVGGLRAGADDYIVKPFDLAELDARITAVLRRSGDAADQTTSLGELTLSADGIQVFARGEALALTPRELHVLRRMMRNAGRIVTKQQLTEMLAAQNEDIGEKSIEVYVHRVRSKIQGCGVEIVTARGFGYMLRAVSPSARPAP